MNIAKRWTTNNTTLNYPLSSLVSLAIFYCYAIFIQTQASACC